MSLLQRVISMMLYGNGVHKEVTMYICMYVCVAVMCVCIKIYQYVGRDFKVTFKSS